MHHPMRNRRLVSVSTSFSATPSEFESALNQMRQKTQRYRMYGKMNSEINLKKDSDGVFMSTVPIKEVESEEEPDDNTSSEETKEAPLRRNLSEQARDR